jgi:hypothetical protein
MVTSMKASEWVVVEIEEPFELKFSWWQQVAPKLKSPSVADAGSNLPWHTLIIINQSPGIVYWILQVGLPG